MICARCDQPILRGQKYTEVEKFSPSAGGAVLVIHARNCQAVPVQTTQDSIRH